MGKIFSILLCLQLIIFPVSSYAETGAGETSSSSSEPTHQEIAAGIDSQSRHYSNSSGRDFSFYLRQIIQLSIAFFATNILLTCPAGYLSPSMYGFFAGGLAYIGALHFANMDFAKALANSAETLTLDETKLKYGNFQIETLNSYIDQQTALLNYVSTQRFWMFFSAIVMAAGALIAVGEIWLPWATGISAGCNPAGIEASKSHATWFVPAVMGALFAWPTIAPFVSSMDAGDTAFSFSGMVGVILGMMGFLDWSSMAWLQFAVGRAITFAALSTITFFAAADLLKKEEVLTDNIRKLNLIKTSMEEDPGPQGYVPDSMKNGGKPKPGDNTNYGQSKNAKDDNSQKKCWSSSSKFSSDCSNPIKFKSPPLPEGLSNSFIDGAFKNGMEAAGHMAKGDYGSARVSAEGMVAKAGGIRKLLPKMFKKVNEAFVKDGKPKIDFDKEIKNRTNEIMNAFNKSLKSKNIAAPPLDAKAALLSDTQKKDNKKTKIGKLEPVAPASPTANENMLSNLDLKDDEEVQSETKQAPTLGEALNDFESSESDVNKSKEASLFAILTNRYFSVYPRILSKRQPKEEPQVPEKKPEK